MILKDDNQLTFSDTSVFEIYLVQSPSGSCLSMGILEQVFGDRMSFPAPIRGEMLEYGKLETSSVVVELRPPHHIH